MEDPDVIQPTTKCDDGDDVEAEGEGGRGRYCKRKNRQCNSSRGASNEMETNESDPADSDFAPGAIVDSHYDISDGDDDLYADNVDMDEPEDRKLKEKQKEQKKKVSIQGNEKEAHEPVAHDREDELYESEGDDLWAPDSDDEEIYMKFKAFRNEDLHCPKFHVGQVFQIV